MFKLLYSLGIIVAGLATGYFIQSLINQRKLRFKCSISDLRKLLQRIALLVFYPIASVGAIWVVDWRHLEIMAMPFIGLTALFSGGIIAFVLARIFKLQKEQTGSYIVCGAFSNLGTSGALICYLFLGEPGFALVSLYKLFEELAYYSIGFPIAKSFGSHRGERVSAWSRIRNVLTDVFVLMTLGSIATGFILNISGMPRPEFYKSVNAFVIPAVSFLLLTSIGMAIGFRQIRPYLKLGFSTAAIKFLCVPTIAVGLGILLGLGRLNGGLPLKVVLILASMPTGLLALVPPTIYDLDIDLANACWFVTTALLLLVVPLQYLLLQVI